MKASAGSVPEASADAARVVDFPVRAAGVDAGSNAIRFLAAEFTSPTDYRTLVFDRREFNSIGVKLAWPDRPVLGLLGEGAAMYGIQGLWSAARYNIPVTFVICNNACYAILKIGAKGSQLPNALEGRFEGLDIRGPEIDYVSLAKSMGVEAHRISEPEELSERVSESLRENKLQLFDVPIARETPGKLNYG